jgi:hypothetical protein
MISEKSGMLGGKSYVANLHVLLDDEESHIRKTYGVHDLLTLGEEFEDKKPISGGGHLEFARLLDGNGVVITFGSIQQAKNFIDIVLSELKRIKGQITATKIIAESIGEEFVMEI